MYSRKVGKEILTFGVTGKLWRNAFLMYDHQTDSEWLHYTGECISGSHEGKTLEILASAQRSTFQAWRRRHPDSLVLSVRGKEQSPAGDVYADYHSSERTGIVPVGHDDDRLPMKQGVLGLLVGDERRAYPTKLVSQERMLADDVGEHPVLLVRDATSRTALAWSRRLGERTLALELTDPRRFIATDAETGTRWDLLSGTALSGELEGAQLEAVALLETYWFSWRDYHPTTSVYAPPAEDEATDE